MFDRHSDVDDLPLDLDEKDVKFLRSVAAPQQPVSEKDDLTFEVCSTCASPIWKMTNHDGSGLTTATLGACCPRCEGFQHRHPEVFAFVLTFAHARRFIELRLRLKRTP